MAITYVSHDEFESLIRQRMIENGWDESQEYDHDLDDNVTDTLLAVDQLWPASWKDERFMTDDQRQKVITQILAERRRVRSRGN